MAERDVDARGLSCPQPVLNARRALEALGGAGVVRVLVDTVASRENVARMARNQGCTVSVEELAGGDFRLIITRP